jgi:hypothetical protein
MSEPISTKFSMYVMPPEPISKMYFINPSHQSVCLHVYPPHKVARQRLGRCVPAATNTHNNRRTVGGVVLCTVRVILQESLWVCLCISLSLLSNCLINTFPRQRSTVRGVVFNAIRVASKVSKRLLLTRNSCLDCATRRRITC